MSASTLVYKCNKCDCFTRYTLGRKTQTCGRCNQIVKSVDCKTNMAQHIMGNLWGVPQGNEVFITELPKLAGGKLTSKQLKNDIEDAIRLTPELDERAEEFKEKFRKEAARRNIKLTEKKTGEPMFTPANEVEPQLINLEALSKEQYDLLLNNGTLEMLMGETRTYEEFNGIKPVMTAEKAMESMSQAFMKFSVGLLNAQCAPGTEKCEQYCKEFIETTVAGILHEYGFEMALNSNK